jgi:hypothetical protein
MEELKPVSQMPIEQKVEEKKTELMRYTRFRRKDDYKGHREKWLNEKEYHDMVREEFAGKTKILNIIKKEIVEIISDEDESTVETESSGITQATPIPNVSQPSEIIIESKPL